MHARQRGFTYIGLLVTVVIMGLLLTMTGRVWSTTLQREREEQLLWAGHAYRLAIGAYFRHGGRYPQTLAELLQDDRSPVALRYLRQLYPDPITGTTNWELIMTPDGQGIMGVASRSNAKPIKRAGFDLIDQLFDKSECYCDWKFVFFPRRWGFGAGALPGNAVSGAPAPGGAPTDSPIVPVDPGPTTPRFGPGFTPLPGAFPLQPGNGVLTPGTTMPTNPNGPH